MADTTGTTSETFLAILRAIDGAIACVERAGTAGGVTDDQRRALIDVEEVLMTCWGVTAGIHADYFMTMIEHVNANT